MDKGDCEIGQRVKITPTSAYLKPFEGLMGTIKELPLGYVVMSIEIAVLSADIVPVKDVVQGDVAIRYGKTGNE